MREVRQSNEGKDEPIRLGAMARVSVLLALMAALGAVGFLLGAGSIATRSSPRS